MGGLILSGGFSSSVQDKGKGDNTLQTRLCQDRMFQALFRAVLVKPSAIRLPMRLQHGQCCSCMLSKNDLSDLPQCKGILSGKSSCALSMNDVNGCCQQRTERAPKYGRIYVVGDPCMHGACASHANAHRGVLWPAGSKCWGDVGNMGNMTVQAACCYSLQVQIATFDFIASLDSHNMTRSGRPCLSFILAILLWALLGAQKLDLAVLPYTSGGLGCSCRDLRSLAMLLIGAAGTCR